MIQSIINTVKAVGRHVSEKRVFVNLVRYLPARARNGRLFVIGDLHGEYNVLMVALQAVDFDFEKDRVIFTGDLHDRGGFSAKCLDMLQEPWADSVLGNHELMMLMAIDGEGELACGRENLELWIANGGEWALDVTSQARSRWRKLILENAPLYWVVERRDGKKVLICHAEPVAAELCSVIKGKNRKILMRSLNDHQALWGRRTLSIAGRDSLDPQLKDQLLLPVDEVYFSVHGHTRVSTATWVMNRLFVDTGAVLDNRLTLVDTDQAAPGRAAGITAWDLSSGTMHQSASVSFSSAIQSGCE